MCLLGGRGWTPLSFLTSPIVRLLLPLGTPQVLGYRASSDLGSDPQVVFISNTSTRRVWLCQSHHELHRGVESEPASGWFQKSHPSRGTLPLLRERSWEVGPEGAGHFQAGGWEPTAHHSPGGTHSQRSRLLWLFGGSWSLPGAVDTDAGPQCSQCRKHLARDFRGCGLPEPPVIKYSFCSCLELGECCREAT